MDLKHEMRTFIATGCTVAIGCAIPIGFFLGIGGALVSAVVAILATCVVGVIRNRIAQNTQQSFEGHTQIQGVLDSSQLGMDEDEPAAQDVVPFARHGKLVAAAISLAFCLVTAGIVGAATRGVGINFYLGGAPQTTTKSATSSSSSTKRNTESSQERTQGTSQDEGTVETWYPPTEDESQNTGTEQQPSTEPSPSSSSTSPVPSPSPAPAPSQGGQSSESQGSGSTSEPSSPSSEPSTPTQAPANSGTINDASQNAKEQ